MSTILTNGINLPDVWPPRDQSPATSQPMRVPYLERPPAVIPIDEGRQLLVDDFLIEDSMMPRAYHYPVKHPGNPVLFPETMDGCSHLRLYGSIIMPLSINAAVTVLTLHFVTVWKDLITPLVYFNRQEMFTLSLGLKNLMSHGGTGTCRLV